MRNRQPQVLVRVNHGYGQHKTKRTGRKTTELSTLSFWVRDNIAVKKLIINDGTLINNDENMVNGLNPGVSVICLA